MNSAWEKKLKKKKKQSISNPIIAPPGLAPAGICPPCFPNNIWLTLKARLIQYLARNIQNILSKDCERTRPKTLDRRGWQSVVACCSGDYPCTNSLGPFD